MVERHVAAMMRKREEEELERYRLGERAEALRKQGEATLVVLGDLDVDSDSEAEDDGRAGAMGVARRDARRDGTVPLPPDAVTLRPLDASELGMAYAWMRRDQRRYNGATKFWDNAAEGIQELFEDPAVPGHPSLREILHPPWPRVVGAFAPALSPAPVGFALFKDDGLTVDAMGVRHGLRRLGIGRHIARAFVDRAKIAALALAGPPEYRVDSVPSATSFWRALGFEARGGSDSPTTRVMRRLCGDVSMVLTLVEDPPTPVGDEWWLPRGRDVGGGGGRGEGAVDARGRRMELRRRLMRRASGAAARAFWRDYRGAS